MEDIIIYNNSNSEMLFEHLYTVGGYATYAVSIKTNGFTGVCHFCISMEDVKQYVMEIKAVIENLTGSICLKDCESDAYIEMFFNDDNVFIVKGQLGGSYEINILKFEFIADQTILLGLKRNILKY